MGWFGIGGLKFICQRQGIVTTWGSVAVKAMTLFVYHAIDTGGGKLA